MITALICANFFIMVPSLWFIVIAEHHWVFLLRFVFNFITLIYCDHCYFTSTWTHSYWTTSVSAHWVSSDSCKIFVSSISWPIATFTKCILPWFIEPGGCWINCDITWRGSIYSRCNLLKAQHIRKGKADNYGSDTSYKVVNGFFIELRPYR